MKKGICIIYLLVLCLFLCACGKASIEKSRVEQIDEQLSGTWVSYDSDTVVSKWTFYDGTYAIGSNDIHTVTSDQKENVEGNIPFTFEDGSLMLNGATGTLEKEQ